MYYLQTHEDILYMLLYGAGTMQSLLACVYLLQHYCIDTQLYLQHDLTLAQLAQAIGTNRFYLSKYFSSQGTTYNAYINDLRINHFVSLYRQAVDTRRPFTAQELAHQSGYRSYSTFSLAFKQRMGQAVTIWMRDNAR
jgi:AraC-like DNA-binding protein